MNNAVRTILIIYVITFMVICLFFIPCKQFTLTTNNNAIFTGKRYTYSIFEMYNIISLSNTNRYFYYIDWQVLWIELLPLTVFAAGTSLAFKR